MILCTVGLLDRCLSSSQPVGSVLKEYVGMEGAEPMPINAEKDNNPCSPDSHGFFDKSTGLHIFLLSLIACYILSYSYQFAFPLCGTMPQHDIGAGNCGCTPQWRSWRFHATAEFCLQVTSCNC
ncbi:hypothetical protein CI102_6831 [Trichoderma harzianum]|uniref:Uncharacterized protein n=1 Tax=Trichoderma harzianum CBS 226.95 TaxID=983964 RepID=A0A2T4ATX4_TRIHA|nr:hypothetical protein M431DRAFT_180915 [Trichoderma harzianum CBS 226.95]PKK48495.1 hypothetical protein CI102_6831 [Trichoderma harzianum]PTB60428.1 hypothetical protein M431DRAFT_180915 [Trichoderma harzianum CBS 226.95]